MLRVTDARADDAPATPSLRWRRAALALALANTLACASNKWSDLIGMMQDARRRGDHAHALEWGNQAASLATTTGLREILAEEYRATNQLVEALDQASRCVTEADASSAVSQREELQRVCRELVTTLSAQVGRLTVNVPGTAPAGLRVRVRARQTERPLAPEHWGAEHPALPGPNVVEAVIGDRVVFEHEVQVAVGEASDVTVTLPPESELPHEEPKPQVTTQAPASHPPASIGPWIVAGSGLAVVGMAVVFGVLRSGAETDRDAACSHAGCLPVALDHQDRFTTYTTLTNVSLGVGFAAIAGGATWFVLDRLRVRGPHARLHWNVSPAAGGALIGMGGAF